MTDWITTPIDARILRGMIPLEDLAATVRLAVLADGSGPSGPSEQERIRWLEGHLIEFETGRHPQGPASSRPVAGPPLPPATTRSFWSR
jgi:hypothetical protein